MNHAKEFLAKLDKAVQEGKISHLQAYEDVFTEMSEGDHDAEVESLFFNYTQGKV